MGFIASEPKKLYLEDFQFGASVSEAGLTKMGASVNFIYDEFVTYTFGVSGGSFSSFSSYPYTASGSMEPMIRKFNIENIHVLNEITGTSGATSFRIEKQLAAGGAWTNIFSTNCTINFTTVDNVYFNFNTTPAPTGVIKPVLASTTVEQGDKLRFVLITAATGGTNLKIDMKMRPIT